MEYGSVWLQHLTGTAECSEREMPGVRQDDKPGDASDHTVVHKDEDNCTGDALS